MDCRKRVKKVCKAVAVGLGNQPEQIGIAIEAPGFSGFKYFEINLAIPINQFVGQLPFAVLVCGFYGNRADP
ncbi:MAG TPA: hypothetical protein ENG35_08565 [Desulfobacteraceae bacterium]|nr:hypothetical protein [Desulfobacteraceae bacterium]